MSTKKIPECFRCPLTREIFTDPVLLSDGFTYEREAVLLNLFNSKQEILSPMTGEKLDKSVCVSNRTLSEGLKEYRNEIAGNFYEPDDILDETSPVFSSHLLGTAVKLDGSYQKLSLKVSTVTDPLQAIGFVDQPYLSSNTTSPKRGSQILKIKVSETSTDWGCLMVGFSTVDFKTQTDLSRIIHEYSYWLDADGWLRCPDSSSILTGWNTREISVNDILTVEINPIDGRFLVYLNNEKKIDVLPETPIKFSKLWAFVSVYGSCKSVVLVYLDLIYSA
jgi:U-box domain/Neuralized